MLAAKQKSTLFDEETADQQVIRSLLKELNRSKTMSTLTKDENGTLLALHQFEVITLERAKELEANLTTDLDKLKEFITQEEAKATNEQATNTDQATQEGQPVQPTDTATQAVAEPTTEAPIAATPNPTETAPEVAAVDPAPATPEVAAPADPSVAPATDPAGNPITLQ